MAGEPGSGCLSNNVSLFMRCLLLSYWCCNRFTRTPRSTVVLVAFSFLSVLRCAMRAASWRNSAASSFCVRA